LLKCEFKGGFVKVQNLLNPGEAEEQLLKKKMVWLLGLEVLEDLEDLEDLSTGREEGKVAPGLLSHPLGMNLGMNKRETMMKKML
jgi:hypothetical protein